MHSCYNVKITGKVQDIGFRSIIENIAILHDLKGFVFNDADGSVKMVCCGENSIINKFFKEIRSNGEERGIVINDIAKEEIPFQIYLPPKFIRLYTDELADIGRKLDKGNELLGNLPEIKDIMGSFVIEQRQHNKNLEKILEKIAER